MFSTQIATFNSNPNLQRIDITHNEFIIKVPIGDNDWHFYVINTKDKIGFGKDGEVYKASRIDPITGEIDTKAGEFAVKQFKELFLPEDERFILEYNLLNEVMPTEKLSIPASYGNFCSFFISKLIKGESLAKEAKKLNFTERLIGICQFALWVNYFHCFREKAVVHADIKPPNLKLQNYTKQVEELKKHESDNEIKNEEKTQDFETVNKKAIELYLIDFGISLELKSKNPNTQIKCDIQGNSYFPLEAKQRFFGLKTDIYMMVMPIFEMLGGDENILYYRGDSPIRFNEIDPFPDLYPGIDLRKLTANFINKMRNEYYDYRYDSNEVLQFFISLYLLSLANDKTEKGEVDKEFLDLQMAKMIVTAILGVEYIYLLNSKSKEFQNLAIDLYKQHGFLLGESSTEAHQKLLAAAKKAKGIFDREMSSPRKNKPNNDCRSPILESFNSIQGGLKEQIQSHLQNDSNYQESSINDKLEFLNQLFSELKKQRKNNSTCFFFQRLTQQEIRNFSVLKSIYYSLVTDAILGNQLSACKKQQLIAECRSNDNIINYHVGFSLGDTDTRRSLDRLALHAFREGLLSAPKNSNVN